MPPRSATLVRFTLARTSFHKRPAATLVALVAVVRRSYIPKHVDFEDGVIAPTSTIWANRIEGGSSVPQLPRWAPCRTTPCWDSWDLVLFTNHLGFFGGLSRIEVRWSTDVRRNKSRVSL
jgi:hypothetical protein